VCCIGYACLEEVQDISTWIRKVVA
jgi:hypothetical protein